MGSGHYLQVGCGGGWWEWEWKEEEDANGFPFLTVALFRATHLPVPLPPRQVQGEHGGVAAAGPLAFLINLPHTLLMY